MSEKKQNFILFFENIAKEKIVKIYSACKALHFVKCKMWGGVCVFIDISEFQIAA